MSSPSFLTSFNERAHIITAKDCEIKFGGTNRLRVASAPAGALGVRLQR
jgi:hypothetical protein